MTDGWMLDVDTDGDAYGDATYADLVGPDGVTDSVLVDTDADGLVDRTFSDTDGDGTWETAASDTDRDGTWETQYVDTDGNGSYDRVGVDTDGDGVPETTLPAPATSAAAGTPPAGSSGGSSSGGGSSAATPSSETTQILIDNQESLGVLNRIPLHEPGITPGYDRSTHTQTSTTSDGRTFDSVDEARDHDRNR